MIIGMLSRLGAHGALLLFAGVTTGLLLPPLAALAWPLVLPVTFVLFVASVVRLDMRVALGHARRPLKAALIVAAILAGAPLLAAAALQFLPAPPSLALSVILMATSTPLLSSPAFALLLGLEAELALIAVLGAMILVPLTMPGLALALLGLDIDLSPIQFMARLAAFVILGFAVAALLRWRVGLKWFTDNSRALDGVNVILLVIFAVGVMDGVTAKLLADPAHVLLFAATAFAANVVLQTLGAAVFAPAGRRTALTVGLMFGYRNMALPLAVLGTSAPPDFVMYVALAQLPMYMLPVMTLPIYRRLLGRNAADMSKA